MSEASDIVKSIGDTLDELVTSDEERGKIQVQLGELSAAVAKGQQETNNVEAQSTSFFVAGWRPAIGWIGATALAYQFLLYPLLVWGWSLAQAFGLIEFGYGPPPPLDAGLLFSIVTGMLGIAGLRSFDKLKGTDTARVG